MHQCCSYTSSSMHHLIYLSDLCRPVSDVVSHWALQWSGGGWTFGPRGPSWIVGAYNIIWLLLEMRLLAMSNTAASYKLLKSNLYSGSWTGSASEVGRPTLRDTLLNSCNEWMNDNFPCTSETIIYSCMFTNVCFLAVNYHCIVL